MMNSETAQSNKPNPQALKRRSKAPLYWVLAICIAPAIAAYTLFYTVDWRAKANTDTTNYGELLPAPVAMPDLSGAPQVLDAQKTQVFDAKTLYKKWVYVTVDSGACDEACATRLVTTRQLRAMMGRERDRIARLWLVTDDAPVDPRLFVAHPDLVMLRVKPQDAAFLKAAQGNALTQHIWIIDPLARPMMRYPVDYDHKRMKTDLTKLLYASKGWQN